MTSEQTTQNGERFSRKRATPEEQARKRRRIRFIILVCLALVPLIVFIEAKIFSGGQPLPFGSNLLIFALINTNVLLLLLMVFLILRNLVELIFERRQKILGARLRTKLVISFVSLALLPSSLLFFVALQFVSTSMDYWFNINVEQALKESQEIARNTYGRITDRVQRVNTLLAHDLAKMTEKITEEKNIHAVLDKKLSLLVDEPPDAVTVFSSERVPLLFLSLTSRPVHIRPQLPADIFRRTAELGKTITITQDHEAGELISAASSIHGPQKETVLLLVSVLVPRLDMERLQRVSEGIEGYRRLLMLKKPFKISMIVMLLVVTLLIVFSAIWFGLYVARGLTGPIDKLAHGTRMIVRGQYDFMLEKTSHDEMGLLIDSFNRMTAELSSSKKELEQANIALTKSNMELDQRRRSMETILRNVAAGVISFDEKGVITTVNRFAEELLHISSSFFVGHHYKEVLAPQHQAVLEEFLHEMEHAGKPVLQRHLRLTVAGETFSLLVNFTRLTDEKGRSLGIVLVFDNLTQLEKAQRMAAWREVARRIAHEVKNPLTPIQLSAQRLRKRYLPVLEKEKEVFDQCTTTIIDQVEELKKLVSEFSSFARLPVLDKKQNNINEMIDHILVLYQEAHKEIRFTVSRPPPSVPPFLFDQKQLKRGLINLLDNAVAVVPEHGHITLSVSCDPKAQLVVLEVADNGPGIAAQDKARLFEPYFSTKKTGTGLGLAIVNTIVSDHGGTLEALDNTPSGALFRITLPLETVEGKQPREV